MSHTIYSTNHISLPLTDFIKSKIQNLRNAFRKEMKKVVK